MSPLDLSLRSPLQQLTAEALLTGAQQAMCPSSEPSAAEGHSHTGIAPSRDMRGVAAVSASAAAGGVGLAARVDAVTPLLLYARQLTASTCDR